MKHLNFIQLNSRISKSWIETGTLLRFKIPRKIEDSEIRSTVIELIGNNDFANRQAKRINFAVKRLGLAKNKYKAAAFSERGDVPGWVLVVLMTTGLVTGIWTVAQPRLSSILKNSLDNMNSIR